MWIGQDLFADDDGDSSMNLHHQHQLLLSLHFIYKSPNFSICLFTYIKILYLKALVKANISRFFRPKMGNDNDLFKKTFIVLKESAL